jgi:nitrogen regulatory protein PII
MMRVEIVANKSVQQDLLDVLDAAVPGIYYTVIPDVQGRGRQGVRMGDDIWPEKNFMVLIFCNRETSEHVEKAVCHVKKDYPYEGIKLFVSDASTA